MLNSYCKTLQLYLKLKKRTNNQFKGFKQNCLLFFIEEQFITQS